MSNRLGGKQGTAYTGTNANQPPNWTFENHDPNQYNTQNVSLGDLWLNQTNQNVWMLVSLKRQVTGPGSIATWVKLESGGISALDELTGNTGGPITPDNNANINIVGDGIGITITGNPATNTLTASLVGGGGGGASSFPTDFGTATQIGGVLNIKAGNSTLNAGQTVSFSAPGSTNLVRLNVTDVNNNTIIGFDSGNNASTGTNNTVLGSVSMTSVTSGSFNTAIGQGALDGTTTGSFNIAVGADAGLNYTSFESNNILIGSPGVTSETHTFRLGAGTGVGPGQINRSFVSGIVGITPATADGIPVFIGSAGQLGTVGNGGASLVSTLTGNGGGPVSPLAGNINVKGDGTTIVVTGDPLTHTLTIVGLGGGGGTVAQLDGDTGFASPSAGIINIIAGNASLNSGSSVSITGDDSHTLTLNVTDANSSTIIGADSGNETISGTNNTVLGDSSAQDLTTGSNNTLIGQAVAAAATTASSNTIVGAASATSLLTGSNNLILGAGAGTVYTTSESKNILIGASGVVGESNVLHIGSGSGSSIGELNKAFISGIVGVTPDTADGIPVFIGSAGQLGTVGTGGTIFVQTLTGNNGGPISPAAGNINIVGDNVGVTIVGTPGDNTLTVSLMGGGDAAETFITDFGTAEASGGVLNIIAGNPALNSGSSVSFSGSGNTVEFNVTDANNSTIIGSGAGNISITGTNNTALGYESARALTTGSTNVIIGVGTAAALTTGALNTIIGAGAGPALLTGTNNTIIGTSAGSNYSTSESNNIVLGANITGTSGQSNTLTIGAGTGTSTGQINKAFISGIRGITPATADGIPVFIGSAGQLGTVGSGGSTFIQTVTGNSGGPIQPSLGNLNIVGDGTTIVITGNPLTNTLTVVGFGGGGGTLSQLDGDTGSALPASGIINIEAGNAALNSGSSVSFTAASNNVLLNVTDANINTMIGFSTGNLSITGTNNTALGASTATDFTTAANNTVIGGGAADSLITGSFNTIVGSIAGSSYTGAESSNILLGSLGTVGESNVLRIGNGTGTGTRQLNKAFIQGIRGITPATTDGIPVFIGSTGQLGTVGSGGTSLVSTITGNAGGAVGPSAGNINIVGDGTTIVITGNPLTNTLTVVGLGGGGGTLSQIDGDTGSALPASGIINIEAGNAALNSGSSVSFSASGNTVLLNVTDENANTLVGGQAGIAGVTGLANTALGAFSAGSITSGSRNNYIGYQAGALTTSGSSNIFIGYKVGSLVVSGSNNFLCGDGSLSTVLEGTPTSTGLYAFGVGASIFLNNWGGSSAQNTFVGTGSGGSFNSGQIGSTKNNTACGSSSLLRLTTGTNNTTLGFASGTNITTGSLNTLLGVQAGSSFTSSESSNICIGANVLGTVSTSNTLTIGAGTGTGSGQINVARISGIRGVTTGVSNAIPVVIDSTGQLGTAGGVSFVNTLTGNTGGAVNATAGNVNVVGDGTSITVTGTPGTSTLTIKALGGSAGPSFFAYLNSTTTAVTGANTPYTIIYDTIGYNLGSAFNLGTSTFTAPITGFYNFSLTVQVGTVNVSNTTESLYLSTSNYGNMVLFAGNPATMMTAASTGLPQTRVSASGSAYINMDAGDTVTSVVNVSGGTGNNVRVQGTLSSTFLLTFFSGQLV